MSGSDRWDGDGPFTRSKARKAGLSNRQIQRGLTSGELKQLRHGVLSRTSDVDEETEDRRGRTQVHRHPTSTAIPLQVQAALLACPGQGLVVSHTTAARLWGLPQPLAGWPDPQFTKPNGRGYRRRGLHVRRAPLGSGDAIELGGVQVTSVIRTVVDCLRSLGGQDGLAILDAALHQHLVATDGLLDMLRCQQSWPGVMRARQLVALGDAARESPLESWSAWTFRQLDIPEPLWQREIQNFEGDLIGRVDCWWPGLAGEADGRSKYALAAAERGGDAEALHRVLHEERRREQRLRDIGVDIVRWSAAEVLDPNQLNGLAQRLQGALARANHGAHFKGRTKPR